MTSIPAPVVEAVEPALDNVIDACETEPDEREAVLAAIRLFFFEYQTALNEAGVRVGNWVVGLDALENSLALETEEDIDRRAAVRTIRDIGLDLRAYAASLN